MLKLSEIAKVPILTVLSALSTFKAGVVVSPQTLSDPLIPTPPVTTNAPFDLFVDEVEFVILSDSSLFIFYDSFFYLKKMGE